MSVLTVHTTSHQTKALPWVASTVQGRRVPSRSSVEIPAELSELCPSLDDESAQLLLDGVNVLGGASYDGKTSVSPTDPYRELMRAMEELKDSMFDVLSPRISRYLDADEDSDTAFAIRASVRAVAGRRLAGVVRHRACVDKRGGYRPNAEDQRYRDLVAAAKLIGTECKKDGWNEVDHRSLLNDVIRDWEMWALPVIPLQTVEAQDARIGERQRSRRDIRHRARRERVLGR